MKIPFYKSSPVCMAIAAITILTVAGCGGSGSAAGLAGGFVPPTLPPGDDHGNAPRFATQIFPDNGKITGAINFASSLEFPNGDVDWFKFSASEGATYVIQFLGFPIPPPSASSPEIIDIQVLESDATTSVPLTWNAPIPAGIPDFNERRIMFTGQSNGAHYIRVAHARPLIGTGNYVFNLASSQIGDGSLPFLSFTQDYTVASGLEIRTDTGDLLFDGMVSGDINVFFFDATDHTIRASFSTDSVFLLDNVGVPSDNPETAELHIHFGVPDNFEIGDDVNATPSAEDHANLLAIPGAFSGGGTTVIDQVITDSVYHIMIGHEWYADLHFTSNANSVEPRPILSSRANGTLAFFETALQMTSGNVIPPDPTPPLGPGLELLYNSAYQRFMIGYEVTVSSSQPTGPLPAASLIGGAMHVHRTTDSFILIELGVLPGSLGLPQFENPDPFFGTRPPFIKNVVHTLTDDEVASLREATYTTGWYVDLHDPTFPFNPLLRAEGFIGIQTNPAGLAGGVPN